MSCELLTYSSRESLSVGQNGIPTQQYAIEVTDAHFSYGLGRKSQYTLQGVSLKVPTGCIYGLLGASGCGKTTLLNVLNGCLELKSGSVSVFGMAPGSPKSCVPGPGIGFMPQELALYPDFTIQETLSYFGRIHQMNKEKLKARIKELLDFLDLKDKDVFIREMSGGQQRRVSLAVALIHQPPLLVLDEPTVGVDILLRQNIWEHLVGLTVKEGMTILITTHYIEETSQANFVGLMREGRMIVESRPQDLMNKFGETSLEKCFFKICKMEANSFYFQPTITTQSEIIANPAKLPKVSNGAAGHFDQPNNTKNNRPWKSVWSNILALLFKNVLLLKRNIPVVLFQMIMPAFQVMLVCFAIGGKPFHLDMAVVNLEPPNSLSQQYLGVIDKHIINQQPYPDLESALESVRKGFTWGAIYIGRDFSSNLLGRVTECLSVKNETLDKSSVKVYMDITNPQNALVIQRTLMEDYQTFARSMLKTAGATPQLANFPVLFETPVYGKSIDTFTDFVVSGINMSTSYFLAVALTVLSFIEERRSGLLNRSWVSGVSTLQILTAQMLTQSIILVCQVGGLVAFTYGVFKIPINGPLLWIIALLFLQGVFGMSFGLLLSSVSRDANTAMMIFLGSFYSFFLLSGMVWPIESQPYWLRYVSNALPQTIPTEAIRAVVAKGWGIETTVVWSSALIMLAWTAVSLIAASVLFRVKK